MYQSRCVFESGGIRKTRVANYNCGRATERRRRMAHPSRARSQAELEAENAALRRQIIELQDKVRPL